MQSILSLSCQSLVCTLSGAQVIMFSGLHLSSSRICGMIFIMKVIQWLQEFVGFGVDEVCQICNNVKHVRLLDQPRLQRWLSSNDICNPAAVGRSRPHL